MNNGKPSVKPKKPGPFAFLKESLAKQVKTEELSQDDVIIAVMGPTGSGKSTFIRLATGFETGVRHDLQSCTSEINIVKLFIPELADSDVVFVDTPGFDHTDKSDVDILKMVADWLKSTYEKGVLLSGILYFHRITDNRMAGTPLKNLRMFEELCGRNAFHNIILTTTMWDEVDEETGVLREQELKSHYWRSMLDRNSTTSRFMHTRESALRLIEPLIDAANTRTSLLLQQEMVDMRMKLPATSAGQKSFSDMKVLIKKRQEVLEQIRNAMKHSNEDKTSLPGLQEEYQRLKTQIDTTVNEMRTLRLPLGKRLSQMTGKWFSFNSMSFDLGVNSTMAGKRNQDIEVGMQRLEENKREPHDEFGKKKKNDAEQKLEEARRREEDARWREEEEEVKRKEEAAKKEAEAEKERDVKKMEEAKKWKDDEATGKAEELRKTEEQARQRAAQLEEDTERTKGMQLEAQNIAEDAEEEPKKIGEDARKKDIKIREGVDIEVRNMLMTGGAYNVVNGDMHVNPDRSTADRGIDRLFLNVTPEAFHDSGERLDPPIFHPNTRMAVIREILDWLDNPESPELVMWLHGPTGSGKSAIAQVIAQVLCEQGRLSGSFFFTRGSTDGRGDESLVATLAYELATYLPDTRTHIATTVLNDPGIFKRGLRSQVQKLLVNPLWIASNAVSNASPRRLFIIDDLDECRDVDVQCRILQVFAAAVKSMIQNTRKREEEEEGKRREEAAKKEAEAERKERDARKRKQDARKREEAKKRKEDEATREAEELSRMEEQTRQRAARSDEDTERANRMQLEAQKVPEDTVKKQAEPKEMEEEARKRDIEIRGRADILPQTDKFRKEKDAKQKEATAKEGVRNENSVLVAGGAWNFVEGDMHINNSGRSIADEGIAKLFSNIALGAFHDSGERLDPPKFHLNTRVSIIQEILDWLDDPESPELVMWLHGTTGTGKSAIAQTIAEELCEQGRLSGSFFFTRGSTTGRGDERRLVPTLAYQLAKYLPATRTHIAMGVLNDPAIFGLTLRSQVQNLLVKPLRIASNAVSNTPPQLFIIDGLDECRDADVQCRILQVFAAAVKSMPYHLPQKLLMTSRSEIHLLAACNEYNHTAACRRDSIVIRQLLSSPQ